jgi:hypothetical protein
MPDENCDIDSMLNSQDLMSGAISEKELNSSTKIGELGDKLKHMEMKDILDIDLDMENQSLTEYMQNLRNDSFEHYSPDQSGEMVLDARRQREQRESEDQVEQEPALHLKGNHSQNIQLAKSAIKPRQMTSILDQSLDELIVQIKQSSGQKNAELLGGSQTANK